MTDIHCEVVIPEETHARYLGKNRLAILRVVQHILKGSTIVQSEPQPSS